ncbi:MAG: hypothetical protein ABII22_03450 [Candidatus Micrarchaeota archaeon]
MPIDLSSVKKISVLQFSSESSQMSDYFNAHEWFIHLLRRDLMCIKSLCVDDYADSPLFWDQEWDRVSKNLFLNRKIDVIIKGLIEYDDVDAILSLQLVSSNGKCFEIEKVMKTSDLLKIEKEVVKEICRNLAIDLSEEENEKISRIPDLASLCSFSKSFNANLQRGMKYQDSINTAFSSIQVPFLGASVGAIILDDFLSSIDDDGSLFALCENGLKADPDDPQMYWRMAKLCLDKNNAKKALEYADKGIAVSPAYARNYLIAAMAYEELGDSHKAMEMGGIAVSLMNIEG